MIDARQALAHSGTLQADGNAVVIVEAQAGTLVCAQIESGLHSRRPEIWQ